MKCENCNAELLDNTSFCPYCGTKTNINIVNVPEVKEEVNNEPQKQAGCWKVFGKVASILGTIAVALCWLPLIGTIPGSYGIVFGILGRVSKDEAAKEISTSGLRKSIIGTCVSFGLYILLCIIIISAAAAGAYYY